MGFVAFPLRLAGALMQRCQEPGAVLSLIEAMARTPHGSWRGNLSFGLRDYFAEARRRPELPQEAVHELNEVLADLGITSVKVVSIQLETSDRDEDCYSVVLSAAAGSPGRHALMVRRPA